MKNVIILAMHGIPPNDFPKHEVAELFRLATQLGHGVELGKAALKHRHNELDAKMRSWPRNEKNDPYYTWSQELAANLSRVLGDEVIVGFNEFCAPSLDEALEQAVMRGAERVVVITPMMTRGGEHSEVDIPAAIKRAEKKYPQASFVYAWPFDVVKVAKFLATQIAQFA